jgi:hypothetical protein
MRRYGLLAGAVIVACSSTPEDPNLVVQPTRVRVSPAAFLGSTPCSDLGGMKLYQATLLDVTDGFEGAFTLPSSALVPCTADVEFEFVRPGRYYIAQVKGYDRSDLKVQGPGSPLVTNSTGDLVSERWKTTCWGQDGITRADLGLDGQGDESGMGGGGPVMGVRSFSKTVVTVRGCEPLSDAGEVGRAYVAISIHSALVDAACGNAAGTVGSFRVVDGSLEPELPAGEGGLGGNMISEPPPQPTTPCGQTLLIEAEPGAGQTTYAVEGLDAESGETIWTTSCRAIPREGITVVATCDPARLL